VKNTPATGEALVLPPLISYGSVSDFESAYGITPQSQARRAATDKLKVAGLPPIPTPTDFGLLLGVSPRLITAMAFFPRKYYRQFRIPKRSGGNRKIVAPRIYLKTVQKFILRHILQKQKLSNEVTGFVRGRGILQNARVHRRAKYLVNVDLKDFFGSIHTDKVITLYRKLGFSAEMARVLAQLCTYENCLPQGAPTSPYLANLAFARADAAIVRLCSLFGISYSRYADDLTFSRSRRFPKGFDEKVRAIVQRHGFEFNFKKTRHSRPGQSKLVTGLLVNEKIQPPRETRRKIRAMFHKAWVNPAKAKEMRATLLGWASFVKSYDVELGSRYLRIAGAIPES
jgi:RNA-directed DNA polymerase